METKDADQITRVVQINPACSCFSADVFNPNPMGVETQKWRARIVNEDTERRNDMGESGSRQLCGLPATWAANSFKTFWLQSFAMVQARTQANSIGVWVRKSTPLVGPAHEE